MLLLVPFPVFPLGDRTMMPPVKETSFRAFPKNMKLKKDLTR